MVDDLVEHGLDLSAVYAAHTESRGAPPYDPRLMLKVLVYGYSHGITSSRALERRCHDDVAFRFLTADHSGSGMTGDPAEPGGRMSHGPDSAVCHL